MWIALYGGGGTPDTQAWGDVVSSNSFDSDRAGSAHGATILYSMLRPVVAGNFCRDFVGGNDQSCYTPKADVSLYAIRGNTCVDNDHECITGNMDTHNAGSGEYTYGDISHNLCLDTLYCLQVGNQKVSTIGRTDIFRNTFEGTITIENLLTVDGPYVFTQNAVQNENNGQSPWPYFNDISVTDTARATFTDNLTGTAASPIIDAAGTPISPSHIGTYGHLLQ
jgi:hypothetical protein